MEVKEKQSGIKHMLKRKMEWWKQHQQNPILDKRPIKKTGSV